MACLVALATPHAAPARDNAQPQANPQPDSQSAPQPVRPPNPHELTLTNPDASTDDRRAAALQLWEAGQTETLARIIARADPAIASPILRTVAEFSPVPPPDITAAVIEHLALHGAQAPPAAVRMLAPIREKEAIGAVIAVLSSGDADSSLTEAAIGALIEQTGREDLGEDPEAWVAWWEEARWLPAREWEAMQAAAHAERARRLQREAERNLARIIDLHRRMHDLTPQDQRSALLATMMGDEARAVRLLAFELAERALLNTQRLDDSVKHAAIERLKDPASGVRTAAASLLFRLGAGQEAAESVRLALGQERDPKAAAAMFTLLRRNPSESDLAICLEWLGAAEPAASAAARTLFASATDGVRMTPRVRSRALASLRAMQENELTPGKISLLGVIGAASDRARLESLLAPDTDPSIRRAAAGALTRWPGSIDALAQATRHDPALLPTLTDALSQHQPTPEGELVLLQAGASAQPDAMETQRRRLRRAMPPRALLATLGSEASSLQTLEEVLLGADALDLGARDPRLILTQRLIDERYAAGDNAGVAVLVNRIDPSLMETLSHTVRQRCRRALICTERYDDAARLGATEEDWRAAIDRLESSGSELAQAIRTQFQNVFPDAREPGESGAVTSREKPAQEQPRDPEKIDVPDGSLNKSLTQEPAGVES